MDSFHIRCKWSLVWEGVSGIMVFDHDLYLEGHSVYKTTKIWHIVMCPLNSMYSSGWILSILGTNDNQHERVFCMQRPLTLTYIFKLFCSDIAYLMDYIHMWHKYNPWGDGGSRTISRSIGQQTRSQRSFAFLQSGRGYPSRSLMYNF